MPIVKVENQNLYKDMLENFNENVIIEYEAWESGLIICDELIKRGQLYTAKTGTVYYITVDFYSDFSTLENQSGYITTIPAATEAKQDEQGHEYINLSLTIPGGEENDIINNSKSFIIQSNSDTLLICNNITEEIKTGIRQSNIKIYYS